MSPNSSTAGAGASPTCCPATRSSSRETKSPAPPPAAVRVPAAAPALMARAWMISFSRSASRSFSTSCSRIWNCPTSPSASSPVSRNSRPAGRGSPPRAIPVISTFPAPCAPHRPGASPSPPANAASSRKWRRSSRPWGRMTTTSPGSAGKSWKRASPRCAGASSGFPSWTTSTSATGATRRCRCPTPRR